MRKSANRHRRDVEFSVGDKVLLKLQQYRQHLVAKPLFSKLSRCFYGPFEVLERIGQVAYRLQLPEGSHVHNVYHVGLLKPFVENDTWVRTEVPALFARGKPVARPVEVLDRRTVWRKGAAIEEVQLSWLDNSGENPTWEPLDAVQKKFPALLEDKEYFCKSVDDLEAGDDKISDEDKAILVLNVLPNSYDQLRDAILYGRDKAITYNEVH
ncbi:uncharacterized protein LOC121774837 [Salvia splendens]|uniref:uncharacterized protein LOC121774837 n=1 Tax=Salvia splendens TaxID=180675 RepID=UPI001C26F5AE|nr:uncharacterized protein LOC121774837 [Salvia splendens]